MPKKPRDYVSIVHRVKDGQDTYWLRWRDAQGKRRERRASDHPAQRERERREVAASLRKRAGSVAVDLLEAFEDHCTTELAPDTVSDCRRALVQFANWVHCPTTFDVRADLLREYRTALARSEYAPSTKNAIMSRLAIVLKRWRRAKLCPELGADDVRDCLHRFKQQKTPVTPYTPEHIREVLAAAPDPRFERMTRFALLSGMRRGELADFSEDWVHLGAGVLRVPPMKTGRGRAVDLSVSPMLADLVSTHAAELAGWSRSYLDFSRGLVYSGPEFTWQGLRQTCASYLVNSDILPPYRAARQLGHTLAVAEDRYYGVITTIPKGVASLEEALGLL